MYPEMKKYCQNPGKKYMVDRTSLIMLGDQVYIGSINGSLKDGEGIMLYKD